MTEAFGSAFGNGPITSDFQADLSLELVHHRNENSQMAFMCQSVEYKKERAAKASVSFIGVLLSLERITESVLTISLDLYRI